MRRGCSKPLKKTNDLIPDPRRGPSPHGTIGPDEGTQPTSGVLIDEGTPLHAVMRRGWPNSLKKFWLSEGHNPVWIGLGGYGLGATVFLSAAVWSNSANFLFHSPAFPDSPVAW